MTLLYTFQAPGHDITQKHEPTSDYRYGGAHYEIAQYLGWESWIWCFESLADWHSEIAEEWLTLRSGMTLWILEPPLSAIRWCGLRAQCENKLPISDWFHSELQAIRARGDVPMGLVEAPVNSKWIV